MPSVIMLSVFLMLSVTIKSIVLYVIILNVVAPYFMLSVLSWVLSYFVMVW
jgi:hypothetical protein